VSNGVTIELRGADRLARTLAGAADDLRNLTAANRAAADGIARAAHPPRRSGRLASSITTSATATAATVGSSLVYAPVIEYGWAAHGIEATRFLTTAAENRKTATVGIYEDAVNDAVGSVKGV
jgi:phage gpG-like protein